jgi:predicted Holliday junction resolvase-like endonuclease
MIILFLILAVLILAVLFVLWDIRIEQRILKDELSVHFRLLHSIDRNVAEILTKIEEEGDL